MNILINSNNATSIQTLFITMTQFLHKVPPTIIINKTNMFYLTNINNPKSSTSHCVSEYSKCQLFYTFSLRFEPSSTVLRSNSGLSGSTKDAGSCYSSLRSRPGGLWPLQELHSACSRGLLYHQTPGEHQLDAGQRMQPWLRSA